MRIEWDASHKILHLTKGTLRIEWDTSHKILHLTAKRAWAKTLTLACIQLKADNHTRPFSYS